MTKRVFVFDDAGRSGTRALGGPVPERAGRGPQLGTRPAPPPLRGPGALASASARSSTRCGRRSPSSRATSSGSTSAAPPGCSTRSRARSSARTGRCSSCSSSGRRCSTCSREALDPRRPFVRVGHELDDPALRELALVGALRAREPHARPVSLIGPMRMDYEKAIGPSARRRPSSRGSSRSSTGRTDARRRHRLRSIDGDHRARLLRAARRRARRDRGARSRRRSARSRASCTPTSPTPPTRRSASGRSSRPTRCSPSPRRASSTTASATRAAQRRLRADRASTSATSATSSRRSSATTSSASAAGARGAARGADVAAEIEIELVEAARGVKRDVPFQVAVACSTCGGNGAEPGTAPVDVPDVRRQPAGFSRSRARVFGQFVRTQTCPRCGGAGRIVEHPARTATARAASIEERTLDGRDPARDPRRPAHPAQRRGARRAARRPRRRPLRARPRAAAIRASCARATTSSRPST